MKWETVDLEIKRFHLTHERRTRRSARGPRQSACQAAGHQ